MNIDPLTRALDLRDIWHSTVRPLSLPKSVQNGLSFPQDSESRTMPSGMVHSFLKH